MFKKILSLAISAVLFITTSIPIFAETRMDKYSTVINGISYQIKETVNSSGNKVVTVIGNGETNIVTNTGDEFVLKTIKEQKVKQTTVKIQESFITKNYNISNTNLRVTSSNGFLSTPFWNYSYYYVIGSPVNNGTYWSLSAGDQGSYSAWDRNNSTARSYAESFMSDVQTIFNQQTAAIAAMGAAAAGAAAGAISAGTGVGLIVGIVIAAGGSVTAGAMFVAAWTASLNANYHFNQFKAIV